MTVSPPFSHHLQIVCLCAQWCGTCRDYRPQFDELAAQVSGHTWRWVDIEDEAEAVEDLDIETFPTLVIAEGTQLLFAGPVLPRAADALRLIESVVAEPAEHARLARDQHAPLQYQAYERLFQK